ALPITRQVLRALCDRAVLIDHAGTGDADKWRELKSFGLGGVDQLLQHLHNPFYGTFTTRLVIGVAPEFGFEDAGLRQIGCLPPTRLDHAAADIGAANVNREDAVMGFQYPGWRQMKTADQPGVVRMKADRQQIDFEALRLENDVGARDRNFADPAFAKAATNHDSLGIGPTFGLEKPLRHIGELVGEFLDRAMH